MLDDGNAPALDPSVAGPGGSAADVENDADAPPTPAAKPAAKPAPKGDK